MLGYEYIFPNATEYEIVRERLATAGFTAWLSPIIILVTIYIFRRLTDDPTPTIDTKSPKDKTPPSNLQLFTRRLHWQLTQPLSQTLGLPLSQTLGPPSRLLAALAYLSYLIYIAQKDTGRSYLHLTKALGHVAVSQLPWHYLLALKTPNSPITLATGLTHERLNAWHRTLGRVIAVLAFGHAALYLKFFVDMGVLRKRMGDWEPRLGLAAVVTLGGLMAGSLAVVRRKSYYRGFYGGHVLLSAALVVVLWLHMTWTRRYVAQMGVFWVANAVLRGQGAKKVRVEVSEEGAADRGLVVVKLSPQKEGEGLLDSWVPGQHVYLRLKNGVVGWTTGRKNPFTIADVSQDSKPITFVARKLNGTTARLNDFHSKSLGLEGPYGEAAEYMPSLLAAGKAAGQINLYAGGIGATYTIPIYLALLKARGDTHGLKMTWFVKTPDDASWGIELLQRAGKRVDVDLYLTRAQSGWRNSHKWKVPGLSVYDLREQRGCVVRITNLEKSYEKLTVMICGPPSFSAQVRAEIGDHVWYGREVKWFEEEFGFGG